ncbi:phosphatidylserine decarboxylase family protein [Coleophoma crateriformis]|uniref:Phosphatidylserine decarboxylase family protein n=1 Tax=Coleophoma crateriformis TaxID=565419 RepID=A0A3D8RPP8_9HELO|nr:phosphatidylserine decarboxylase family protein [Coleophoma crateriformis]
MSTQAQLPSEAGHEIPKEHHRHRTGGWMPADHRLHKEWLQKQVDHVDKNPQTLPPVLVEFKKLIETNPRIHMYFTAMFEEIPVKRIYQQDPTGNRQIRDYEHMLQILAHILRTAPHWTDAAEKVGMVGVPMNAVFDYPMSTPSGHAAFLDPEVNAMVKKVLNEWGKYLKSPESAKVLGKDKNGWFGETATKDVESVANKAGDTELQFPQMFKCDPKAEYHGYKSWDDFFTRELNEEAGYRPIAAPDDDSIIANACESKPFSTQRDCKLFDRFWIKGQPYSVGDMLAQDPLKEQFDGATVYQAFLSALSYHRWHSPVSGTIKKAYVVDGTYFSEPLWEGLGDPDTKEINKMGISSAQGYISSLAVRAIIFIEADNKDIGLMAFIGIGMDEVSTCDITVKEGQHVKKGEQTGMFHFGGSSHCLLFRKGVQVGGFPEPGRDHNVPVRSAVAAVKSS